MPDESTPLRDTHQGEYARRLQSLEQVWWKRVLDVQRPYRWNLKRQQLGRTLDVGAGLGRNLGNLPVGSVGVDHNAEAVAIGRSRGLDILTIDEFVAKAPSMEPFDSMLVAHVLEHMDEKSGDELLAMYLPYVRPGGKVMMICPQERGYASDPTHVRFVDLNGLRAHAERHGLEVIKAMSFPLPRLVGKAFVYNEFVLVARRPDAA